MKTTNNWLKFKMHNNVSKHTQIIFYYKILLGQILLYDVFVLQTFIHSAFGLRARDRVTFVFDCYFVVQKSKSHFTGTK